MSLGKHKAVVARILRVFGIELHSAEEQRRDNVGRRTTCAGMPRPGLGRHLDGMDAGPGGNISQRRKFISCRHNIVPFSSRSNADTMLRDEVAKRKRPSGEVVSEFGGPRSVVAACLRTDATERVPPTGKLRHYQQLGSGLGSGPQPSTLTTCSS